MDKDGAKSRKPPHSAESSKQQLQKKEKFTPNDFPFGKPKSKQSIIPSQGTANNKIIGGTIGMLNGNSIGNLMLRPQLRKSTKSGNLSFNSFNDFLSRNSSTSSSRAATATGSATAAAAVATARGLSNSTMSKGNVVAPALGGSKPAASPSSAAPAAASTAGGIVANVAGDNSSTAPLAIGDATATNAIPLGFGEASNAAVNPDTNNSQLDILRVCSNGQSWTNPSNLALFVLKAPPVEGEPLDVIGAVDAVQKGKVKLQDLLHTAMKILSNVGPSGRKLPLNYHVTPRGDAMECVWLIPQKDAQEQIIMFQGERKTIPANSVARGFDEMYLPLRIVAEELREQRRSKRTDAVTLATSDGRILGTLPLAAMAGAVLGVRYASATVGSIIPDVHYVHTEVNDDEEEVHTPRVVSIRVRTYRSTDGQMGVTTKLGEMVLKRPHLVMPRDAMPLPIGQRRINTTLAGLNNYSVAYVS